MHLLLGGQRGHTFTQRMELYLKIVKIVYASEEWKYYAINCLWLTVWFVNSSPGIEARDK